MASPSESHVSATRGTPVRPASDAAASEARERLLRTLVSLLDDLTLEREEPGLLRAAVEHAVGSLGLAGGLAAVIGDDGEPRPAAAHQLAADSPGWNELARAVLAGGRPLIQPLAGGGSLCGTPLRGRQRTLGVLVLHDEAAGESSLALDALEALGKQVGTGLENVRLYAELLASAGRIEVLRRITAAATSERDLASVLPGFAAEMRAVVAADRVACGFVNDSGDYIEMVSHPQGTCWGLGVLPIVGSGPGFVALNDRPVLQRDLVQDHRFLEDMRLLDDGLRSYLLLPLRARERAIGVLALGSREEAAFDDAALARLQPMADAVALAFENLRLLQKTREMSITDEVTPLHNFRYFHTALDRELKLVHRHGGVLSLLFIDLDHFKPINDSYGHLRGSRTLREVGFLIRSAVRETDIPARYGGDEFVVILPRTDGASARVLAEKLRRVIEDHTFLQEESINARLGVSLGIASYPADAANKEALIRLADGRMYEDKDTRRAGR